MILPAEVFPFASLMHLPVKVLLPTAHVARWKNKARFGPKNRKMMKQAKKVEIVALEVQNALKRAFLWRKMTSSFISDDSLARR